MADTKLELTEAAMRNMTNMYERVRAVADKYGRNSDEHMTMLQSLIHALLGVVRLGGRIMAEDDLSLLGDSFITFGCIFHPKRIDGGGRDDLLGEWSLHS